ncbi:glycoside hydrolase family 2 protein [Cohnella nanjingensis]|uniref:beta-mannosidase n=1 Tax=Cohnella nanjingensis TaxID=1387779 RepID=A0A7X0RNK6_9BACL|nr:glycoside hydrolase family 2 TIM barrel-domain containing protein [Cohnella nanjingensis]MBB6670671.1 hypothetical protein [Cohnella nanjingensis]
MSLLRLSGTKWTLTGWYPNQWRPELSMELGVRIPPAVQPIPATVPGSVQTDLLAAGLLPDPFVGLNSQHCEWTAGREWCYETAFELPEDWSYERSELVFEGLDYAGCIQVNGELAAEFEGMFTPVRLDVTDRLYTNRPNSLKVVFYLPPEIDGQVGYSSRIRKLKSRFNYAWDWCPRMIATGIWRDAFLQGYRGAAIRDFYPRAVPEPHDAGTIDLQAELEVFHSGLYEWTCRVIDPGGAVAWENTEPVLLKAGKCRINGTARLAGVEWWWPNGMGAQPLYEVDWELRDSGGCDCGTVRKTVGFRTIEWLANPGAPAEALPYTAVVNGQRLFLKGVNWVPISPYYGSVTPEQYAKHLSKWVHMNVNLVRVWGGGIIEREAFYDYCNRNGLLVWQELLQSSSGLDNCPPDDPELLTVLSEAAKQAILEKRAHPSLLLWCGGNELMWEGFRPVDERHANMAMLGRLVRQLDPGRRFLPASASGPTFCASEEGFGQQVHHDVHGPWTYLGAVAHYAFFNRDDALLRSETGTAGASRASLIRSMRGSCRPWPPTADNAYWVHRGSWWIPWETISQAFGPWDVAAEADDQLESFVQCSRFLQKESLRYAAESTRRREPEASGFIVWMGNEPYPNNANTSVLEYDSAPKPAYYALKASFSPVHVSARYERVSYPSGERFRARLYLHREVHSGGPAECCYEIYDMTGTLLARQAAEVPSGETAAVWGEAEFAVADLPYQVFFLRLTARDEAERLLASNDYIFTVGQTCDYEPLRMLPQAEVVLDTDRRTGRVSLRNVSTVCAVEVWLSIPGHEGSGLFEHNGWLLLPGESSSTSWIGPAELLDGVAVDGFNVGSRGIPDKSR